MNYEFENAINSTTADDTVEKHEGKELSDDAKTTVRLKRDVYDELRAKCKAVGCSTNEFFNRSVYYADVIISDIVKERKEKAEAEKFAELNRLAEECGYSLVTKNTSTTKKKTNSSKNSDSVYMPSDTLTSAVKNNVNSSQDFAESASTQHYEKRQASDGCHMKGASLNVTDGLNEGVKPSGVVTASTNGVAAHSGS